MRGVQLRPYQVEAINALHDFLDQDKGNPIVSVPTGGGKSLITAGYVESALQKNPKERFLIAAHVKEIVAQNAEAQESMLGRPVGIYCAGMDSYELDKNVTVASIQSIYDKPEGLEGITQLIVDECHRVSPDFDSMYARHIHALRGYNPNLRIIGLTATPFRLKGGLLHTMQNAVFNDIAYHVPIIDLIVQGYLCKVISRRSLLQANLKGVRKVAGEFHKEGAENAMDLPHLIKGAVNEILELGRNRRSWLLFCAGVAHAEHVTKELRRRGIKADCIFGHTPYYVRDALIEDFKAGKLRALVNADVFTTGFDAPNIDLIALLRPTMSPGLYVQMVGRGFRINEGKDNCLVLDYAGNIERFGPVDQVQTPLEYFNKGTGDYPQKMCPQCTLILHAGASICDNCGYHFPMKPPHGTKASDLDILSIEDPEDAEALRMFPQLNRKYDKNRRKVALYIAKLNTKAVMHINLDKMCNDLNMSQRTLSGVLHALHRIGIIERNKQAKGAGAVAYWITGNKPSYFKLLTLPAKQLYVLLAIAQLATHNHQCNECLNDYIAHVNFSAIKKNPYDPKALAILQKKGFVFKHRAIGLYTSVSISKETKEHALLLARNTNNLLSKAQLDKASPYNRLKLANSIFEQYRNGASIKDLCYKFELNPQQVHGYVHRAKKRAKSSSTPESQQCTL